MKNILENTDEISLVETYTITYSIRIYAHPPYLKRKRQLKQITVEKVLLETKKMSASVIINVKLRQVT